MSTPKHATDLTGVTCTTSTVGVHYATETVIPYLFEETGARHVVPACTEHARDMGDYRPDDLLVYTGTGPEWRTRQPSHRVDILARIYNALAAEQLLGAVDAWHSEQAAS